MKLWWGFRKFHVPNPKPVLLTLTWTLCNIDRGKSFLWRFSHENTHRPSLLFYIVTMSHNTTMCAGFTFLRFFWIICAHFNVWSNLTKKRWPTQNPSLYFYIVTMSCNTTMCAGFIFFWFFLNYLCSTLAHSIHS